MCGIALGTDSAGAGQPLHERYRPGRLGTVGYGYSPHKRRYFKAYIMELPARTVDRNEYQRDLYREMGLLGHQLENLPKCRAIFERYTESYPESWARKIIWAYQRLRAKGKPFYWSDVRKISGVKKKNFQSIIPYLRKHTDDTMDGLIIALVITDIRTGPGVKSCVSEIRQSQEEVR